MDIMQFKVIQGYHFQYQSISLYATYYQRNLKLYEVGCKLALFAE